MISFKQFIIEARMHEIVHHDITPLRAKHLGSKFDVRFAIDKDDKLHVGSAHNFVHTDLSDDPDSHKIEGFIRHDKKSNKLKYWADNLHGSLNDVPSHKILDEFDKLGMHDGYKD